MTRVLQGKLFDLPGFSDFDLPRQFSGHQDQITPPRALHGVLCMQRNNDKAKRHSTCSSIAVPGWHLHALQKLTRVPCLSRRLTHSTDPASAAKWRGVRRSCETIGRAGERGKGHQMHVGNAQQRMPTMLPVDVLRRKAWGLRKTRKQGPHATSCAEDGGT